MEVNRITLLVFSFTLLLAFKQKANLTYSKKQRKKCMNGFLYKLEKDCILYYWCVCVAYYKEGRLDLK